MNLLNLLAFLLCAGLFAAFLISTAIWVGLNVMPEKEDDFFNPNN